jgi:tRNA(fMet)-specific endonuclease VapC
MILLDTDHLSVFMDERDSRQLPLKMRLAAAVEPIACAIVTAEEVLRGWLATIHRQRDIYRQIPPYLRLARFFDVMGEWEIVTFDKRAADQFTALRAQRIRIGTMDLKIASIALINDATLITANLRDFRQVPRLRCESWLEI